MIEKSLTVLLPEGIANHLIFRKISDLAQKYELDIYISTGQNIRLLGIKEADLPEVKNALLSVGAELKGPGKFPLPKVCVGKSYCKFGLIDTFALSKKILERHGSRKMKPKIKIAISGCPASCSNSQITDIGIKATRSGLDIYAGGKGGSFPQKGRRIAKGLDEEKALETLEILINYHDKKTQTKQRMHKLINNLDFPFAEI